MPLAVPRFGDRQPFVYGIGDVGRSAKNETVIIYGVESVAGLDAPVPSGDAPYTCLRTPVPVLIVAAGSGPLRFNNAPPDLLPKAPNPEITDPFDMILQRMLPLCDPWNTAARDFIERYLRMIETLVRESAAEIAAQAIACNVLFEPRDWVYSAPCPLPRAHIRTAPEANAPATSLDAVDFAFWTGEGVTALDVAPPSLLPKAARARRERLSRAGIRHLEGMPGGETADWMDLIGQLLPAGRSTFWDGETIPVGPFPGTALGALDGMA